MTNIEKIKVMLQKIDDYAEGVLISGRAGSDEEYYVDMIKKETINIKKEL